MTTVQECILNESKIVEQATERRVLSDHQLTNAIILVYVGLLVLSVLTIWFFKRRRFTFIHETGLSVVYGLLAGLIIRFGLKSPDQKNELLEFETNACDHQIPPESIILRMPFSNETVDSLKFIYQFQQLAQPDLPASNKATFDAELFFNLILPPIIFTAGYCMKRRHFFENVGAIQLFAFLGTFLSALTIGTICFGLTRLISSLAPALSFAECLLFGSMLSATDPVTVLALFADMKVDVQLYALVFGESVLNDAIAIVMTQSIENYASPGVLDFPALMTSVGQFFGVFAGSFAIGAFIGSVTALLTKLTRIRDYPLLETSLFVLMSYATFLFAEAIGCTGVVSVLFCGITQAHYTFNNLSEESKIWTKEFFELISFLAENFVFAYIGVSAFTFSGHYWHAGFIFITLFACLVARAVSIYPLSFLINLVRRRVCCRSSASHRRRQLLNDADHEDVQSTASNSIPFNHQHMLVFSGVRGAMAFCLAIRNHSSPMRRLFVSTTSIIALSTVIVCGALAPWMLKLLKIKFVKPLLTDSQPPLTHSLPSCCLPLARLLSSSQQLSAYEQQPTDNGDQSQTHPVDNGDDFLVESGRRADKPFKTDGEPKL